jgi:hypothetical protein
VLLFSDRQAVARLKIVELGKDDDRGFECPFAGWCGGAVDLLLSSGERDDDTDLTLDAGDRQTFSVSVMSARI